MKSDNTNFLALLESLKKNDDQDAFAYFYRMYFEKLCKYVFSLSGNMKLSEDIAQDTFITLWKNREKIEINTSLNAYLYRSAYNFYISHHNKNKKRIKSFEELNLQVILDLETDSKDLYKKRLAQLNKIIDSMPKNRKEIFVLNKLKNYTYKEIAEMRNISERTVEGHIRSALTDVRTAIEKLKLPAIIGLFFSDFN